MTLHNGGHTGGHTGGWEPASTFEEKLKRILVPQTLYYRLRARREFARGEAELRLLPFLADPKRDSIDIGANKGVYTYWLARHSRHVYAYEPNPKMFKVLAAGTKGEADVTISPVALSDRAGETVLRIPKTSKGYSNQGASLNYDKVGEAYGEVAVEMRRLDDEGHDNIGLIKIDVEGHEFAVLDGARETIKRCRPVLIIEIEQSHNRRPILESISDVAALDYRPMFLWNGVLNDFSRFDAARHHTAAQSRDDYIFNFIFLPTAEQ